MIDFLQHCSCRGRRFKAKQQQKSSGHPKGGLDYRIRHISLNLDSEEIQEQAEDLF